MNLHNFLVSILWFIVLTPVHVPVVYAHTNLVNPRPYNPIDCNPPDCFKACPPIWKMGPAAARNSPQKPSKIYKRGQWIDLSWHRNNHFGGFVRFSLVPVKFMFNHWWHAKMAFHWACFESNQFFCGNHGGTVWHRCGTDSYGLAYRTFTKIPEVFPDGDYVLAMAWTGGLHFELERAQFRDYYSCSFVKIQGGPTTWRYRPTFRPGWSRYAALRRRGNVCMSTSQWVHQCAGNECADHPVRITPPGPFMYNSTPPFIFRKTLINNPQALHTTDQQLVTSTLQEEIDAIRAEVWENARDKWLAKEEARADARHLAASLQHKRAAQFSGAQINQQ